MPRGVPNRTRTFDRKADAMKAALLATDEQTRAIYARQAQRITEGWPDFDPITQSRVVFVPQGREGRYGIEVHEVADSIEDARKDGKDFYHKDRGWLLWGTKAVSDINEPRSTPIVIDLREPVEMEA